MLILILTDVQHSQEAIFSFEIGSNCQNHSSSGSFHPVTKIPPVKFPILPTPLVTIYLPHPFTLFGKPCMNGRNFLPTPKSPTFKDISGFSPNIRIFPGCITFLSLRNQKFTWNFTKTLSAVFLETVILINWLTGWEWYFHKTPFCLKTRVQQYQ